MYEEDCYNDSQDLQPVKLPLSLKCFFGTMLLLISFCLALAASGCRTIHDQTQENKVEQKRLDGVHNLRKMFPTNDTHTAPTQASGGYFLFGGSFSYTGEKTTSEPVVYFAWQDNEDGAYAISSVPLSRVRIELGSYTTPRAYFLWHQTCRNRNDMDYDGIRVTHYHEGVCTIADTSADAFQGVDEVTFQVNYNDWPEQINLPLQTAPTGAAK